MKRKLLAAIVAFSVTLTLFSCGETPHEQQGTFYSLSEAYRNGLLTVDDLHDIKDEMTNKTLTIDEEIATVIKKDYYAFLQGTESWKERKIPYKDIIIDNYYGEYNANYVIIIAHANEAYPAIGIIEEIGGVEFHYGLPSPQVWRQDK